MTRPGLSVRCARASPGGGRESVGVGIARGCRVLPCGFSHQIHRNTSNETSAEPSRSSEDMRRDRTLPVLQWYPDHLTPSRRGPVYRTRITRKRS